jgi:UDP-N-acetylmuramyl pentapeptide synthase
MPREYIATFADAESCLAALRPRLTDGDTVLVKASHALNGSAIVRGLRALEGRLQD